MPEKVLAAVRTAPQTTEFREYDMPDIPDEAALLGAEPEAGRVERVVAWQAAHRVREDIEDGMRLLAVQCDLVRGLEALGDLAAAYDVARAAFAENMERQPGEAGGRGSPDLHPLAVMPGSGFEDRPRHGSP